MQLAKRLSLLVLLCLTASALAQGDDPPAKGVRTDKHGDPLPVGAMARLGTQRLQGAVGGLVFAPDGKTLAALNGNSVLHVYDVETGKVLHRLAPDHPGGWTALAFSPNGKLLAANCAKNRVCLWDLEGRRLVREFVGHTQQVATLAFSHDGKTLATGARDKTIRLWEVDSGKPLHALAADQILTGLAFSPKSDRLASVNFDRKISIWDVATGALIDKLEGTGLGLRNVLFTPGGMEVITSSHDGMVTVWDLAGKRQSAVFRAHKSDAAGLAMSRDGSVLVTGGQDQLIRIWNWEKKDDLIPPLRRPGSIADVAVSPDGKTVAAADSPGSRVKIWRLVKVGDGIEARPVLPDEGHGGSVNKLIYFPDGKRFLSGGLDYTIRVWDELARRELYRIGRVDVAAVSPDSKLLALAERNDASRKAIQIYDAAKGTPLRAFYHKAQVFTLAFSRDGRSLIVGGSDNGIRVLEVASGDVRAELSGHKNSLLRLVLAPDGFTLVSGAFDHGRIWDLISGRLLDKLHHDQSSGPIAISPDGQSLAYEHHETGIHLRKLGDKKTRRLAGGAFDMAFSRDGRTLAAACKDEKLRIWDIASGKLLKEWQGHTGWQMSVAFSPDGRTLLTGGGDTCIVLWPYDEFMKGEPIAPIPLASAEVQERLDALLGPGGPGHKKVADAWADLPGPGAAAAYHAVLSLAAQPKESVPYLKEKLAELRAAPVAELLTDLDNANAKRRADAQAALAKLGGLVEFRLRQHLDTLPGAEARAWLERHLALRESGAQSAHDEGLRASRCLEVLEMLGNAEARAVLVDLAKQTAFPELAQEARSSLARLGSP